MNLVKLKIKAKHLATEPAIIRHEERKVSGMDKLDLQYHRKWDVRNEARATQLAIAFLKGKDINSIEPKLKNAMDHKHVLVLQRVVSMVRNYGGRDVPSTEIRSWFYTKNASLASLKN